MLDLVKFILDNYSFDVIKLISGYLSLIRYMVFCWFKFGVLIDFIFLVINGYVFESIFILGFCFDDIV